MPTYVQHKAAEREFRRVFIAAAGDISLAGKLLNGLSGIKGPGSVPGSVPGLYFDFLRPHSQHIALLWDICAVHYSYRGFAAIAAGTSSQRNFSVDVWDKIHPKHSFQGEYIRFSIAYLPK